jgi:hypothetical protein
MSRRRQLPRCSAINNDGTRCSRRVSEGGPLCHIHERGPAGAALRNKQAASEREADALAAIDAAPPDLQVLLRRLAYSPDESIRLRAIEALLKWEERRTQGCSACAARAARPFANMDAVVAKATEDQRQQLRTHLAAIKAIKHNILGIPAEENANGTEREHQGPTRTSAEVPESPDHDHAEHVESAEVAPSGWSASFDQALAESEGEDDE